MAREIPGARLLVYPDVGHLPVLEAPARVAADIAALFEVVAARSTAAAACCRRPRSPFRQQKT
jgi:hypothetical protein